jgi:hypothetical protein
MGSRDLPLVFLPVLCVMWFRITPPDKQAPAKTTATEAEATPRQLRRCFGRGFSPGSLLPRGHTRFHSAKRDAVRR